MGVALYMDHQVPRSITVGLRMRGVDVITAHEDEAGAMSDSELLDRASQLGRVLFSQDDDLIIEAVKRQREHIPCFARYENVDGCWWPEGTMC